MSRRSHGNALEPGHRLREYRIESVLGQGGFGITYRAFDTTLERAVAIKEYLPVELAVRESDSTVRPFTEDRASMFAWGLSRFLDEARTLARLKHPNLVQVYAVLEENATAYMVMPFEEGRPLAELMNFGKLKDEAQLLAITHALLDGLEHVHEAGFLHRDIKPDNIYVREDGSPVLIDFGSARVSMGTQARSRMTSVVSPGYAPYEQYHGDASRQGPWTDIYGLAATLYAAVCGGRAPMDSLVRGDARIEDRPDPHEPAVKMGRGEWSQPFLAAIDAALGFRPEERPQSVAQWRAMLPQPGGTAAPTIPTASARTAPSPAAGARREVASAGAAPPDRAPAPARGDTRTRGALPYVLAAVGILLIVGGAGAWFLASQPQPAADTAPTAAAPAQDAGEEQVRRQAEADVERQRAAEAEAARLAAEQRAAEEQARQQAEAQTAQQRAAEAEAARLAAEQRAAEEQARQQAEAQAAQQRATEAEVARLAAEQKAAEEQARQQAEAQAAQKRAAEAEAARLAAEQKAAEEQARQQAEAQAAQQRAAEAEAARLAAAQQAAEERTTRLAAEQARAREAGQRRFAEEAAQRKARADRLASLLAGAAADVAGLRLTSPAGDNAVEKYRAALALDPGNAEASAGLEAVVERYAGLAEGAAGGGDFTKADDYLSRAEDVLPSSERIVRAREELALRRTEREARERTAAEEAAREQVRRQAESARAAASSAPPAVPAGQSSEAGEIAKLQAELAAMKAEQARVLEQMQHSRALPATPAKPTLAVLPAKVGLDRWGHCYQVLSGLNGTLRRELDEALGADRITVLKDAPDRLWDESGIRPKPVAEQVRRFLSTKKQPAILMTVANCAAQRYRVELFLLTADGSGDSSREGRSDEIARIVGEFAGTPALTQ